MGIVDVGCGDAVCDLADAAVFGIIGIRGVSGLKKAVAGVVNEALGGAAKNAGRKIAVGIEGGANGCSPTLPSGQTVVIVVGHDGGCEAVGSRFGSDELFKVP